MNYLITPIIYFLLLFLSLTNTIEYDDNDENQLASPSLRSISQAIHHLSSPIFDSLFSTNVSLTSLISPDQTINLHGLGITSMESNTFTNYQIPIKTIILSSNSLSYLPNNVFQSFSTTLINLNLQRNQFESLKKSSFLRSLNQLRILDLSQNQINEISKENFLGLKHLDTLILRENHLTYLSSASFSPCRKLTTLDLSDNQISLLDSNTFQFLTHLKTLLLNNNPLGQRSLTNYLLKPLRNLKYLDLENTHLENLPPFLFLFNQRLQSIKLRGNYFHTKFYQNSSLKRTFCAARSLIEIDLVSTNIHSLDICTYHQLPSLRRLYLMNNPLHCTCDLFYLKYGDIYRILSIDGNGLKQTQTKIDVYLNRWISRPELRRHLEKAFTRGDLARLPIDLSSFARCLTPKEWKGYEIENITGIYSQCRDRWLTIEEECRNYCQVKNSLEFSVTTISSISSGLFQYHFYVIILVFVLTGNIFCVV